MEQVFDIALVYSAHEWIEALHRHCTNTGDLRIRSLVYDPAILHNENVDACVISDTHPSLSSGFIDSLHENNKLAVGVCDDSQNSREYLASIGIDAIFSSKISAQDLANEIRAFLTNVSDEENKKEIHSNIFDSTTESFDINYRAVSGTSKSISVIGSGGTGATESSVLLSSRLIDCVLVDTDFEHPSIAPRLGLDIEPHILSAIELAQNNPDEFISCLQRTPYSSAIVGVAHSSYARDIKKYEIDSLINSLENLFSYCLFDLGRISDNSQFFDLQGYIVAHSDSVLITCEASPIGILRFFETAALVQTVCLNSGKEPQVIAVVNKCPKNRAVLSQVRDEIESIDLISDVITLQYASELQEKSWRHEIYQPSSWKKQLNVLLAGLSAEQNICNINKDLEEQILDVDKVKQAIA